MTTRFNLVLRSVLGDTLIFLGELAPNLEHAEQAIALYNPQKHHYLAFLYSEDPGAVSLGYATITLWLLGYPDRALQRSRDTLTLARELSHLHTLAFCMTFVAWLHQFRREEQAVQALAEAVIALCSEHGISFWLANGTFL